MSQPRILLNMIVKNEAANLPRALNSTINRVTSAVILDTGSTDDTKAIIRAHCTKQNLPCRVLSGFFKDFGQARNEALIRARMSPFAYDYILLMDADMELVVDAPLPRLTGEAYALKQANGGQSYYNARLLKHNSPAKYHGVTHEYLDVPVETLPGDVWWFKDHATGSNRADKYDRDVRLLEGYLKDHPGDARTLFYLAQTFRDAGQHEKAIELYQQRIAAGGWEEEVWFSQLCISRSYRALGDEDKFISNALKAYDLRPIRAEPLHDLANFYRLKDHAQQTGWLFADAGSKIARPNDMLFVEDAVYNWGFRNEKSILGCYSDKTKAIGAAECDKLSIMATVPQEIRETARRNLYWYLQPLAAHAPSFKAKRIPELNPDVTYVNTNPSIANVDGDLKMIVRTVSYRIRPDGTYDYNGLEAIRTTSFLSDLDHNFNVSKLVELLRPTGFPEPKFKGVLDVEDYRLFPWCQGLYANGCVLEQNEHAWREQFLFKLEPDTGEVIDCGRMEPSFLPKRNEKNWMPILDGGEMKWMYSPGVVIGKCGRRLVNSPSPSAVDQFAGGGQLIPFDAGYLGIVHEARPDPNSGKRYYQHRFVWFNKDYVLAKISNPFVFFDKQIEFAAGLAWNPYCGFDGSVKSVIVSFGVRDCEAWIGTIADHEVRDLIWAP